MFSIVSKQMIVMGIFMFLGAVLYKTELVSKEGSKTLTNILIYIITPVAIFKSLCIERTAENMQAFALSFLLCGVAQLVGLFASHFCFKKQPIEDFAASFANVGFFGIPVIEAVLGSRAVFYMAPLVFFVGTLQHSYGVSLLLGKKSSFNWKRVLFAPNTIGLLAGMLAFFTNLGTKIPETLMKCVSLTSNMSAFYAMTILGIFFIQADLKQLYKNFKIYLISFIKLLAVPVLVAVLFKFIPASYDMKMAILLAFAGPVGSNVANYALLYDKDYSTASLYVSVSTVLCLVSLPLFSAIAEAIL